MTNHVTLLPLGGDPGDAIELPIQFSYKPAVPNKRFTQAETCGGTVVQESAECFVIAGTLIEWTCVACPTDWKILDTLYRTCDGAGSQIYVFTGYWGEVYEVKFYHMDSPVVKGRLFHFGGSFIIMCETTETNPTNSLTV